MGQKEIRKVLPTARRTKKVLLKENPSNGSDTATTNNSDLGERRQKQRQSEVHGPGPSAQRILLYRRRGKMEGKIEGGDGPGKKEPKAQV